MVEKADYTKDTGPAGPQGPPGEDSTVPGPQGETGPPGTTTWAGITDKPTTFAPAAHKTSHQDGGADEISVEGLAGELTAAQKSSWAKVADKPTAFAPTDHHADHETGGSQPVDLSDQMESSVNGTLTAYGETSTIVGWGSFVNKIITVRKVGKMVFVAWKLSGVSNSSEVTFTLPYNSRIPALMILVWGIDNGIPAFGYAQITNNLVTVYKNPAAELWTASGIKYSYGELFYDVS